MKGYLRSAVCKPVYCLSGLFALFLILATGCKPTEQNYKAAYDKAYDAAQKKIESETESIDGVKMESLNGPRVEVVEGDTVLVAPGRTRPFETTLDKSKGRMGIAVAHYKMPTNARKHSADLNAEYPESMVAYDGSENYYVVLSVVPSLKDAAPIIKEFKAKHPDFRYIGLPEGPRVIHIY